MFIVKLFGVLLMLVCAVFTKTIPNNQPAVLTTYAKVANFGNINVTANEGRSSGQSFYTQSSDAKIMAGQNLKNKVIYYVAKPSRVGEDDMETLPAKGEVQERFHPRPYFDFIDTPKRQTKPDPKPTDMSKPSVVYGAPFNSFPVFNDQPPSPSTQVDAKPSDFGSNSPVYLPPQADLKSPDVDSKPDLYDSPYDSYNPSPQSKPDSSKDTNIQTAYPPLAYGPPAETFMPTPAKPDSPPKDMYDSYMNTGPKPNSPPKNMYDSYMNSAPKPDPMEDDKNSYPGYPYIPSELDHPPKHGEMFMSAPPDKGASHEDMSAEGPPIIQTINPPYDYNHHHHHHDHVPPPPADSGEDSSHEDMPGQMDDHDKPPVYLQTFPKDHGYHYPDDHYYDDHHHHHIYHEITTTTTTTEAPEHERVNNNYSYYYLGRKLWYIPLYFSIYFMFYIAALILKSIARHKVNVWSNLPSSRSGRNLDLNNLTSNVTSAIEQAETKYMM